MNRFQALQFIKDNSRCVQSIKTRAKSEYQDASFLDIRIGNNGRVFILQDYGKDGWDLFYSDGQIKIKGSIDQFKELTFVKLD